MSNQYRKAGIVYLVGAGPGHPGLITRMGYELLKHCDAVAYDALVPLELISSLPERVERYYVGRRAGRHSMPREEKNRLLLDLALRGLNVVRLKGGDPSLFGGSAEEAEYLAAAGIKVVVVPGVTAASAVAAACGFPLTDRRVGSWAFLATGHGSTDAPTPVPWKEIAGLHGGTMVIYMGLANLEQTVAQILAGGLDESTPCMVVQGATTGVQQILDSRLGHVVRDCRLNQIKPPALIVVGRVVEHRTPPYGHPTQLSGKRILVTCCAQETEAVCAALRRWGAEPFSYPTYVLEQYDDREGWTRFADISASGGWCLFTNVMEVGGFIDALLRNSFDIRILGNMKIAACGAGVDLALRNRGIKADAVLSPRRPRISPRNLTCGKESRPVNLVLMSEEIAIDEAEWAKVIWLKLFHTRPALWEAHWFQEIANYPPDLILFDHPASVDGFVHVLGQDVALSLAAKCKVVAKNQATMAAARRHNLQCSSEANKLFEEFFADSACLSL